ncbi:SLBB domain-containing protein [Desulfoplanes sp.]
MNTIRRILFFAVCLLFCLPVLAPAGPGSPAVGNISAAQAKAALSGQGGGTPAIPEGLSSATIEQNISPEMIQNLPADVRAQLEGTTALETGQESGADVPESDQKNKQPDVLETRSGGTSVLENLYRNNYAVSSARSLNQFGYNLFSSSTAVPSKLAVPDDRYVLGPNDELSIRIWGSGLDAEFKGFVKKDGTINVPKIGIVPVAGVRYGQVEKIIKSEAEKYIQGINVSVSLEKLRTVEVYVLGEVDQPGLHLVPAFSTVLGGLVSASGITKQGSLRQVYLLRSGKKIPVDLYDLILQGARKADVILKNRDVIFVPRIGKTVAIAGAVANPAIYELHKETDIGDLVDLAGGILPQGLTGRLYVRRYKENDEFLVYDIETNKNPEWRDIALEDGDLLEFKYVLSSKPKVVRLEGHVWRPDVYNFVPGIKLGDILVSPELIKPEAILDYGLLHRYDPVSTHYTTTSFPLQKVLDRSFDQELRAYDRIQILSRQEYGIGYNVSIRGAVWQPGSYIFQEGMTLEDLFSMAGREKIGARINNIELSRQHIKGDRVEAEHIRLSYAKNPDFKLAPLDSVFIPQVKDADRVKTVALTGEFLYPGTYTIKDGERLSDLIQRAGGFTKDAYFYGAKFTSPKSRAIQEKSLKDLIQELEIRANQVVAEQAQTAVSKDETALAQANQVAVQGFIKKLTAIKPEGRVSIVLSDLQSFKGSVYDFKLEDGDALTIPKRPNFVAVMGSVYSPSAYLYQPKLDVESYVVKSGGPTKTADEDFMYVLRANGEVLSKSQTGSMFSRFDSTKLMPGDTIIVPEDLERVPYLRLIKDISDIVFKIATTAGVALAVM